MLLLLPFIIGTICPPFVRAQTETIATVVNGDVITGNDIDNRVRLFALSTGIPATPEIMSRLHPQVARQLTDEKLRMQEIQRRHIVVSDQDIAIAIRDIEQRNNLPLNGLRAKLEAQGVAYRTLVDQIRVQIGWNRVLRQQLGEKAQIDDAEIANEMKRLAAETGQPEYRVAEIFIPVDRPANLADARRFADTIITQLRSGAPFPLVAAQFSQSQNALQGGDEGWVHANQLDPAVAAIVSLMPPGAISNPILVPGGISIVGLRGKREIGRDLATMLSLRQVFLPFSSPLDPAHPTMQQKHQLEQAKQIQQSVHGCEGMEAANKAANSPRPADPGEVRQDELRPPGFRDMIAKLPQGTVSKPLIAPDGIGLVMICSRETKNVATLNKNEVRERLVGARIELVSHQIMRDLQRQAVVHTESAP
jgi:peptidyl-prolyl cis-trans isomerase SurA